jgi:hypothetical protein
MVKAFCRGGPHYWIKKPYTAFEQRLLDAEAADNVRERSAKGYIKEPSKHDQELLANEPMPPFSKAERRRARKEYPDEYWLLDGEVRPLTEEEEADFYRRIAGGPITVVHRSSPAAASQPPAKPPSSPPQKKSASDD